MPERLVSDVLTKPDAALEMTLRPSVFAEFTGRAKLREHLTIRTAVGRLQRGYAVRRQSRRI